MPQLLFFV